MASDFEKPINLGSDEMISMNDMAELALRVVKKKLPLRHVTGPEGVRGRNSDNKLIKQVLGWAPSIKLEDGLKRTLAWLSLQIDDSIKSKIVTAEDLACSKIVVQSTESLDALIQ